MKNLSPNFPMIIKDLFSTSTTATIRSHNIDWLISQFKHDTFIILQFRMLRNDIPYFYQEVIIVISYSYCIRRNSRRTHYYVYSSFIGVFSHRNKQFIQILTKARFRKTFMTFITNRRQCRIITPIRVQMHTHKVHPPSCTQHSVYLFFIMTHTSVYIIISPCVLIKEWAKSHCKSMQINNITLFISQITSNDRKFRHITYIRSISRLFFWCFNV